MSRNLLAFPITYTETAEHLSNLSDAELEKGLIGGTGPMLLGNAAKIVLREEQTIAVLTAIASAMRTSAEDVPERFIQMIEDAIPKNDRLGCPK